jgi:hypothetical protein
MQRRSPAQYMTLGTIKYCMITLAIAMSARRLVAVSLSPESMGIKKYRRSFTSLKIRKKQGFRYGSGRMMAEAISPGERLLHCLA